MKDAATILKALECDEATVNGYRNEIWIEYDYINLILHYIEKDEDECLGSGYYDHDEVDFNQLFIDDVCLSEGCNATEEAYLDNEVSYTATMYCMVSKIQQQYPDAIEKCEVDTFFLDDCDLWGCPENCEYGYRIYLRPKLWENPLCLASLISEFKVMSYRFSPFYDGFVGKKFQDNYHFAFLGTNTKVRRLGYLNILMQLFENNSKIAKKSLSRQLETKAQENRELLIAYKNQKGAIVPSKTGVSAVPYIKLALEMEVIREVNGHYELGKMGRVYLEVKKEIKERQSSPFILTKFQKVFWLERILEQDFVYISTLMEFGFINEHPSYAGLRKCFDILLVEKLETIHSQAVMSSSQVKMTLKKAIERIKDWKKPEVYLEHVIMPRLNWLYDLDLIELKSDLSFTLTNEGFLLLMNMLQWRDLGQKLVCNAESYMESFYIHVVNDVFKWSECEENEEMKSELTEVLDYCFEHFKTIAPNRVTYSVFAAFAKYTMLFKKNTIVEESVIKSVFLPSVADKYIFMYQNYYSDGFIQRK